MSPKLVTIEIIDEASLLEACDILHDARFDLEKAKPDLQSESWSGVFIREFFEDASLMSERPGIIFTKMTFPMAECSFKLTGIVGCDLQDRSRIGRYTFNECQPLRGSYRFLFSEDMEIVFRFREKPCGRLQDIRLFDERGSYFALRNPFRRKLIGWR